MWAGARWCLGAGLVACSTGDETGETFAVTIATDAASSSGDARPAEASSESSASATASADTAVASETAADDSDASTSAPVEGCGNGDIEAEEYCDDANALPCDGCEDCQLRLVLLLDGVRGHYVEIGDVADAPLLLLGTAFTLEAWARVEVGERVELMRRGSGNSGWRLGMSEDGLFATVFGGFDHSGPTALAGTGWHHMAWTYDGATSTLWLDGAQLASAPQTFAVLAADQPLRLGAASDGSGAIVSYDAGRVDEVRVSSSVRYTDAFTPARRHEPDANTLLLLHLDEGAGMQIVDASAHAHAGTATGVQWEPDPGYDPRVHCQ